MNRITLVLAGAALMGLASCTTAPPQQTSLQAEQQLQRLLAGKVAGPSTSCIPDYHASASSLVAANAIAFRVNPGLVYVTNTANSGCEGLTNPRYALVVTSHGPSGLCSGDIVQVRDLQTGTMIGSCSLSEFTPYRNP